jgi:hypothetical protein
MAYEPDNQNTQRETIRKAHSMGTARFNARTSNVQQTMNSSERQYLIEQCHLIRAQVAEIYGVRNSAFILGTRSGITRYLRSVGTFTAMSLLAEIEANNFKDFL